MDIHDRSLKMGVKNIDVWREQDRFTGTAPGDSCMTNDVSHVRAVGVQGWGSGRAELLVSIQKKKGFGFPVRLCPSRTYLFLMKREKWGASGLSAQWGSARLAGNLAHAVAGCGCRMALKGYTGIQLSKDIFHKHNGIKYASVWMEENAGLAKNYKQ